MIEGLKERRKQLGVSLDELAAVLGPGFSRARLSIAERGLIELSNAEQQVIMEAIERLGSLRSKLRGIAETAQALNLAAFCSDIRRQAASLHAV